MSSNEDDLSIVYSKVGLPQSSGLSHHINEPSSSQQFNCPFCPLVTNEIDILESHIEVEHLSETATSLDVQDSSSVPFGSNNKGLYSCPVCDQSFIDGLLLESHFHAEHKTAVSNEMGKKHTDENFSCPVCSSDKFGCAETLAQHVNLHFAMDNDDEQLAFSLAGQEKALIEKQEREEFQRLQSLYGFEKGKNITRQGDATLFRSVEKGQMSAVDYHEKRIMLKMCEKNGIDDGSSASHDIIPHLRRLAQKPDIESLCLCNAMDHYAASVGDSGWGCGYRNLQMMLSALLRHPQYVERLKNILPAASSNSDGTIAIPSISRLQLAIEEAWKLGFDQQGRDQLDGKLSGTCKWIGATEIATLMASFRIRYRLIDFHRPSSPDGKFHPALFDWVQNYFRDPSEFKPPLYFQHQGHSRTIVGIEEGKKMKTRLLILDPSLSREHMRFLMTSVDSSAKNYPAYTKKIWVPMTNLKAKQYQLVCVDSGFIENDYEYVQSKVLRSTRIP